MKLTGNCKEDFKNYLLNDLRDFSYKYNYFINLQDSMQYGVYVDFFDSVGIRISMNQFNKEYWYDIELTGDDSTCLKTRREARTEAIEKANEIYNSKE
jgi:hypothetical protein